MEGKKEERETKECEISQYLERVVARKMFGLAKKLTNELIG